MIFDTPPMLGRSLCLLPLALALACGSNTAQKKSSKSPDGGGETTLPRDPSGFTVLTPSADTRTIYVSNSMGSDSNDGLREATPVKSVQTGIGLLRDGFPDWVLFKRGDIWEDGIGQWTLSGRSPTERMVIGAYGEGDRPRFDGEGIITTGAGGAPESMDNLIFVSLHIFGSNHDVSGNPTGENPPGISWLRGGRDLLFEDIRFEHGQVTFDEFDNFPIERVRMFRCLFLDSFSVTDAHAQGLYVNWVSDFTVEESIFDHCGWHPDVPAADPTMFNHCVYWQSGADSSGVLKNSIIMRGSSHGAQMRSSGRVEGNVFAGNAIGGFLGGDFEPVPSGTQGTLIGNVITEAADITPREGHPGGIDYRGWGWDWVEGAHGIRSVVATDNIFSHCRGENSDCFTMQENLENSTFSNNIAWNWRAGEGVMQGPGPYKDPDRSLATYNASLGGPETFDGFAAEVRRQSKTNWRPAYMAQPIIQYFRDGFAAP